MIKMIKAIETNGWHTCHDTGKPKDDAEFEDSDPESENENHLPITYPKIQDWANPTKYFFLRKVGDYLNKLVSSSLAGAALKVYTQMSDERKRDGITALM